MSDAVKVRITEVHPRDAHFGKEGQIGRLLVVEGNLIEAGDGDWFSIWGKDVRSGERVTYYKAK